jgi:hypothetical protein
MLYLAVQVRGNTKAMHSSTAQNTHDTITNVYMDLAKSDDLNRIWRLGLEDLGSLPEEESGRFFAASMAAMFMCQNMLYQSKMGSADSSMANTFLTGISSNFHSPGFKLFWKERSFIFTQELKEWVADIQSQPPLRPDHRSLATAKKSAK